MSSTFPNCTNTDISGIGVRSATYAQNLISFIPAIVALANDGKISNNERAFIEEQSTNILLTAFGLLISAFIQASTAQGLDNYHLALVLNLSWMNNTNLFIYSLLRLHRRLWQAPTGLPDPWSWRAVCVSLLHSSEPNPGSLPLPITTPNAPSLGWPNGRSPTRILFALRQRLGWVDTATLIGSLHLSLMGALGVWLWSDPAHFSISAICPKGATVTILGDTLPIDSPRLRLVSLVIFGAVLTPVVNLLLPMGLIMVPYFVCMSRPWVDQCSRERAGAVCVGLGLAILFAINVVFLVDTEVSISRNELRQAGQDNIWTLGQTLALLLLLLPIKALAQYIFASVGLPFLAGKKMARALKGFRSYEKHSDMPWDEVRRWMFTVDDTPSLFNPPFRVDVKWLEAASEAAQLDLMQFCLRNGAEIMLDDGSSVLHKAAANGHESACRLLVEFGMKVDIQGSFMWHLVMRYADKIYEIWMELGADINARESNMTPMHRAAKNGHENVVRTLKELGADINARDESNLTPIHRAAANGHENVIHTLKELGADMNARASGHETVVRTLKELGADINARDVRNQTPMHRAAARGHGNVVPTLKELGADIDARDPWKLTPMHGAASRGHGNVVHILKELGADINARDEWNRTPMDKATLGGHENVVRVLKELGADINARVPNPIDLGMPYSSKLRKRMRVVGIK
ncbi:ankyrin repeat-containing domain protein [Mycena amicta]|nr:ankyrin repeat-containing domain protein [Mycena amicta]